jgi:hypothetical protein
MPAAASLFGVPIYSAEVDPISSESVNYIVNLPFEKMENGFITNDVTLLDDPN